MLISTYPAALRLSRSSCFRALCRLLRWRRQGVSQKEWKFLVETSICLESDSCFDEYDAFYFLPASVDLVIDRPVNEWSSMVWSLYFPRVVQFFALGDTPSIRPVSTILLLTDPSIRDNCPPALLRYLLRLSQFKAVVLTDATAHLASLLKLFGARTIPLSRFTLDIVSLRASEFPDYARLFGIPDPRVLDKTRPICLGKADEVWTRQLTDEVQWFPGFDDLVFGTDKSPSIVVQWLCHLIVSGFQIVRLNPNTYEKSSGVWNLLHTACDAELTPCLKPQLFRTPLSPFVLLHELAWRKQGYPKPLPLPSLIEAPCDLIWSHELTTAPAPAAAVVISLYNYSDCILDALASVYAQTLLDLELIVVDDASTDDGLAVVSNWLLCNGGRFARASLLRHHSNSGLASARNTAFSRALAPWCFVVDADNTLERHALASCLRLTRGASPTLAVVHPLQRVECLTRGFDARLLVSAFSWQSERFVTGNYIDAMALVSRSAWLDVGGYSHVPGGWEDYDFWCKLIDAGYHGVLCPEVLATYRSHQGSMRDLESDRDIRRLSRLLQDRHPWLSLPFAQQDV